MVNLRRKYYYNKDDIPKSLQLVYDSYNIIQSNPLFSQLEGTIITRGAHLADKDSIACVTKTGDIFVNIQANLDADKWAYVIAHNLLHLAFGHFDKDKMPPAAELHPLVWNKACDIYVTRFLADIGFGKSIMEDPAKAYSIKLNDEVKIYEYLLKTEGMTPKQTYGLNEVSTADMIGMDSPIVYKTGDRNEYVEAFTSAITSSIKKAVIEVGGHDASNKKDTLITKAAEWFLSHYPLLGGLASSFKIIEDIDLCHKYEIHIAAVDTTHGEIYANPSCSLTFEEWKFVLAHEYLHAGLCHHERCQGRDHYLWNVACDYVINDWLHEMNIGNMPSEGLLYDETLHNMSAEAIYDTIVKEMRRFKKHATFRGYGQGDIFGNHGPRFEGMDKGITLDDFFKNSLKEGLDYHITHSRGYIPAGLIEEIRALAMPPIPWEVKLGKWFDALEKAKDFPLTGPILVITDGYIEDNLKIKREHAFLIPNGNKLPFRPRGKVFYMENKER